MFDLSLVVFYNQALSFSLPAVNKNERGLLGIEKIGENVFLYVTESDGGAKNRVYRYDISGSSLTNQKLLLDFCRTWN